METWRIGGNLGEHWESFGEYLGVLGENWESMAWGSIWEYWGGIAGVLGNIRGVSGVVVFGEYWECQVEADKTAQQSTLHVLEMISLMAHKKRMGGPD